MNRAIAYKLAQLLSADLSGFIDRFGGLVHVAEKEVVSDTKTTIDKFPICDQHIIYGDECSVNGANITFMPDSSLRGISYFEDGGITPVAFRGGMQQFTSRLRLVIWLNPQKFQAEIAEQLSMQVQSTVIAKLLDVRSKTYGGLLAVTVSLSKILPQDKSIFSNYTYNAAQSQYLLLPYQYMAFDLDINFRIKPGCSPVVPADPCP
jgi:hypothetical protein